jgi:ABC-2 type transport system permease protein
VNSIITMAKKDLLLLWRDRFGMFWILLFPLMFALFFGSIGGGGGSDRSGMDVAFVDLDNTEGSAKFIALLSEKDAIDPEMAPEDGPWTIETARQAVLSGDAIAYVALPEGFGETGGMAMFTGDIPELQVGVDPSRTAEKAILGGLLMEASFRRLQDSFSDPLTMRPDLAQLKQDVLADEQMSDDWQSSLITLFDSLDTFAGKADEAIQADEASGGSTVETQEFSPIKIRHADVVRQRNRPLNAYEISFPQAIIWGIMGAAAGLAMMLVQEKTRGTWVRLRLGPHTTAQTLASKGLSCMIACIATIALLMLVGHFVLGVRIHSWGNLTLAVTCSAACFTGLMMIFATLGRTERAVAGWAWGGMMPMAMLGGAMVPLMWLPAWMQTISHISPVKWSVFAIEGAVWRGFTFEMMLLPCIILLAIGLAGFSFGAVVLSRRD